MKWLDIIVIIILFLIGIYFLVELYPETLGEITPSVYKASYSIFTKVFYDLKHLKADLNKSFYLKQKNE